MVQGLSLSPAARHTGAPPKLMTSPSQSKTGTALGGRGAPLTHVGKPSRRSGSRKKPTPSRAMIWPWLRLRPTRCRIDSTALSSAAAAGSRLPSERPRRTYGHGSIRTDEMRGHV